MSQPQNLLSSDAPNGLSNGDSRGLRGDLSETSPGATRASSPGTTRAPSPGATRAPSPGSPDKLPIWLRRFELFLRVVVRLYVGVLILLLPWTHLWDDNRLLNWYPWLMSVASNGVVRGVVSGLGLLNLWIAISDAIHYRES